MKTYRVKQRFAYFPTITKPRSFIIFWKKYYTIEKHGKKVANENYEDKATARERKKNLNISLV